MTDGMGFKLDEKLDNINGMPFAMAINNGFSVKFVS